MQRLTFIALASLAACADQPPDTLPGPGASNFTLYVSNQSFSISPVAIQIQIDGEVVISDSFEVGSQHTFIPFDVTLEPGVAHEIEATSADAEHPLVKSVTIGDDHDYGVIMFWTDADALPFLDYTFHDDAPAFE